PSSGSTALANAPRTLKSSSISVVIFFTSTVSPTLTDSGIDNVGSMVISISMLTKDESTSQVYSNEFETSSAFAFSILPTKNNPNVKTAIQITALRSEEHTSELQ